MTPVRMLSEDDLNLSELTDDELIRAWNLWFELAQSTNEWDPPYSHGVFAEGGSGAEPGRPHVAGERALDRRRGVVSLCPADRRRPTGR